MILLISTCTGLFILSFTDSPYFKNTASFWIRPHVEFLYFFGTYHSFKQVSVFFFFFFFYFFFFFFVFFFFFLRLGSMPLIGKLITLFGKPSTV